MERRTFLALAARTAGLVGAAAVGISLAAPAEAQAWHTAYPLKYKRRWEWHCPGCGRYGGRWLLKSTAAREARHHNLYPND